MKRSKINRMNIGVNIFFVIICILILYPFVCIVSGSFIAEEDMRRFGFSIIPKIMDTSAYEYLLKNPESILKAYGVTFLTAILGTGIGCIVAALYAYAISRYTFPLRKLLTFFATFTMFFGGGMAATYVVYVSLYNLKNSIWVLILPQAFSAMNVIIMRAYFEQLPHSLIESAKIDGGSEYCILAKIMLPLAKPALATIALTTFVGYWNSYYAAMMYMDNNRYVTIQLLLQRMMERVEFFQSAAANEMLANEIRNLPSEALRMSICVITVFPMLLIFPRFQKYFVKGMAVGAVKE